MNIGEEHERFARKNAGLARAFDVEKKDKEMEKKGMSHLREGETTCYNCKFSIKCRNFENMRTGGSTGAASFGGSEAKKFLCDKYEPSKPKNPSMSDKQIKSLLKNAMKGNF